MQWIDRQLNEASLDTEKAMNLTLEWATRLCKAQSATMGLVDDDDQVVRLMAHYGEKTCVF